MIGQTGDPVANATIMLALVTLGLVIIGAVFGMLQVRAQREITRMQGRLVTAQEETAKAQQMAAEAQEKSIAMNAFMQIHAMLNSETSRNNRKIVFDKEFKGIDNGAYEKVIWLVAGEFNQIGALVRTSGILRDLYFLSYARATALSWQALEKYVMAERQKRGNRTFHQLFEWLGASAMLYWKEKYPEDELKPY